MAVLDYGDPLWAQPPVDVPASKEFAWRNEVINEVKVAHESMLPQPEIFRRLIREASRALIGTGSATQLPTICLDHLTIVLADRDVLVECHHYANAWVDLLYDLQILKSEMRIVMGMNDRRLEAFN